MRRPPINLDKVKAVTFEIEFSVTEIVYDDNLLDAILKIRKPRSKNKKSQKEETKIEVQDNEPDYQLKNEPFIKNHKVQFLDRPFEKGMGVDFYIDAARFLPDNVTVTKVTLQFYNQKYQLQFPAESGLPDLNSKSYSPEFNYRRELRKNKFDPTTLALISLETIDKSTNQVRIIGYSAINLFVNRFSKQQPTSENDNDIVLLNGAYQLPIYCQEPFRTAPFNMKKLESLEHLPCGSILIRMNIAPLSEDGLRTLQIKDFPNQNDWIVKGLWPAKPLYSTGTYNTSFCHLRDSEKELFIGRINRVEFTIRESAYLLLKGEGKSDKKNDDQLYDFIDDKITKTSNTVILDMKYFAKYQPEAGFKFSLDGVHNTPKSQVYVGMYSLNPPGSFYKQNGDSRDVQLNSNLNWDCPINSIQFNEGFARFTDIKFQRNLAMVIDIKTISFDDVDPKIETIGWTMVPIFSPDGYVKSGIFQVPLIQGSVVESLVQEAQNTDPWDLIIENISKKNATLKWLQSTSVIVRILDAQREDHFNNAYDPNRINYDYIPKQDLKLYAYNQAVAIKLEQGKKLSSTYKGNLNEYNKKISDAFTETYNLTQYSKRDN